VVLELCESGTGGAAGNNEVEKGCLSGKMPGEWFGFLREDTSL